MWNLVWPMAGTPDGSVYFDNQPNILDQFMINKGMTAHAALNVDPATTLILKLLARVNPRYVYKRLAMSRRSRGQLRWPSRGGPPYG